MGTGGVNNGMSIQQTAGSHQSRYISIFVGMEDTQPYCGYRSIHEPQAHFSVTDVWKQAVQQHVELSSLWQKRFQLWF
jgi:hypothetical protein